MRLQVSTTIPGLAIVFREKEKLFFFGGGQYWGLNAGLRGLVREALYHLSHSTSSVLCWVF
jgi:hypothetical protein